MKWKRDMWRSPPTVTISKAQKPMVVPGQLMQLLENRKKNQPVAVKLETAKQVLRRRIVVKRK